MSPCSFFTGCSEAYGLNRVLHIWAGRQILRLLDPRMNSFTPQSLVGIGQVHQLKNRIPQRGKLQLGEQHSLHVPHDFQKCSGIAWGWVGRESGHEWSKMHRLYFEMGVDGVGQTGVWEGSLVSVPGARAEHWSMGR